MNLTATTLEIERDGDLLILRPAMDAVDLGKSQTEAMVGELREVIDHTGAQDVILDLHGTTPFDSQTQRLSVELWTVVKGNGRSMAICFI